MTALARCLLIACAALLPAVAWGYAAFDDIQPAAPVWLASADAAFPGLTYRVLRSGCDGAELELWNRGSRQLACRVRLDQGFAAGDGALEALTLAPGARTRTPVPRPRLEQGLYRARLQATTVDGVPPPSVTTLPPAATVATYVQCFGDDARFRAEALACTVRLLEDGSAAEIHFKNLSHDALHFAFRLAGHQPATSAANPRMHVLPGSTAEVLVPLAHPDPRVAVALVDIWDVRVGADQGALLLPLGAPAACFAEEPGWSAVQAAGEAEGSAAFAPRALLWRIAPDGEAVQLRNASTLDIACDFRLPDLQHGAAANPRITLAPGAMTSVPVRLSAHAGSTVSLTVCALAIAGAPLPACGPAAALALPAERFTATPRVADRTFNARTLAYVAARGAGATAQLTVANLSAVALHAEFRLAGYQDPALPNPRLHLAAGEQRVLSVPVLRSDARLALAQLQVWDVRVGDDDGPLCCALPR